MAVVLLKMLTFKCEQLLDYVWMIDFQVGVAFLNLHSGPFLSN